MRTLLLKIDTKYLEPGGDFPDGVWESTLTDDASTFVAVGREEAAREAIASVLRIAARAIEGGYGPIGGGGEGGSKKLKHEPERKPDPTLQVRS